MASSASRSCLSASPRAAVSRALRNSSHACAGSPAIMRASPRAMSSDTDAGGTWPGLRSSLALRQAEIATVVLRIFTAHTQSDSCSGLDAQAAAGLSER